jgi:hypothetical protein
VSFTLLAYWDTRQVQMFTVYLSREIEHTHTVDSICFDAVFTLTVLQPRCHRYLESQGNFAMNMSCNRVEDTADWSQIVSCETQLLGFVDVPANYSGARTSLGNLHIPSALVVEFDGCMSGHGLDVELTLAGATATPAIQGVNNASYCVDPGAATPARGFYRRAEFLYVFRFSCKPLHSSCTLHVVRKLAALGRCSGRPEMTTWNTDSPLPVGIPQVPGEL